MCTKNKVENDERGPPIELHPIPQPIPSISGNINALLPNNNNASYAHTIQNISEQIINEHAHSDRDNMVSRRNKVKDPAPSVCRGNLKNGPDENKRQGHKFGTVRKKHNGREKKMKTNKKTTKMKLKNAIRESDVCCQTNRRLNRGVILDELINTSDCNLSDVPKNLPIHQNTPNRSKRKIHNPLIKNAEPFVSYIVVMQISPKPLI